MAGSASTRERQLGDFLAFMELDLTFTAPVGDTPDFRIAALPFTLRSGESTLSVVTNPESLNLHFNNVPLNLDVARQNVESLSDLNGTKVNAQLWSNGIDFDIVGLELTTDRGHRLYLPSLTKTKLSEALVFSGELLPDAMGGDALRRRTDRIESLTHRSSGPAAPAAARQH